MKQLLRILSLTLFVLIIGASGGLARTFEVCLRIPNDKSDEIVLKRENFVRIKEFILQQGKRETYCNIYNNNPAYQTANYRFYLNPDTGQQNGNCDVRKSDFQNVTIRISAALGKENQYRTVEFADQDEIRIISSWPTEDLTISAVRSAVVDAIKEMLAEIGKRTPNHAVEPTGALTLQATADFKPLPYADNLLDAVTKPSDQQDPFIKEEAAKLTKSQVPTADEAAKLALAAFNKKPGLDARETLPRVAGLYRIGRDVIDFAKAGDLVWEVRVSRFVSGVSGVIWVSTTTKTVKVLFPFDI